MTLDAIREIEYDGLFAFKYSKRRGTKACSLDEQVPEHVKTRRLNNLLKIQEEITERKNKDLEGAVAEILVGGPEGRCTALLWQVEN